MIDDTALNEVVQLLRAAARTEVMPRFRKLQPGMIRTKSGPTDFVTEADEAAEVMITNGLHRMFPGCLVVGEEACAADPALLTQPQRVASRTRVLPIVGAALRQYGRAALMEKCERLGLPFAPITRPVELFDDVHLNASGGLVPLTLPNGEVTKLPALPLSFDGERPVQRSGLPKVGEHTAEIMAEVDALLA